MKTILPVTRSRSLPMAALILACAAFVVSSRGATYEWTFSNGNLSPALGNGVMSYADGATTQGLTTFGTTDGTTVPHIGGQPATFMHFPAFAALGNGYSVTLNDTAANGGGAYVNQYSMVFDVYCPGSINWTPFFNTNPDNANDADFYISDTGALGIGDLGYSAAGLITANTWYRVAFVADLGAGTVSYYVNGATVVDRTGGSLLDGRYALFSNADAGPDLRLFNEGDTSGQYTHELYLSGFMFADRALSAAEVQALGGANAVGIVVPEPGVMSLMAVCGAVMGGMLWRRRARCN